MIELRAKGLLIPVILLSLYFFPIEENENNELFKFAWKLEMPYILTKQLEFQDVNEDGIPELLIGAGNELYVYHWNKEILDSYEFRGIISNLIISDIDLDRKKDWLIVLYRKEENRGFILVLDEKMIEKWRYEVSYPISYIVSSDIDMSDGKEIIFGNYWSTESDGIIFKGKLILLNYMGEEKWTYEEISRYRRISTVDLDSDGYKEIITIDWTRKGEEIKEGFHIFSAMGKVLWGHEIKEYSIIRIIPYDMDLDGLKELVVGVYNYVDHGGSIHIFTFDGKEMLKYELDYDFEDITIFDIDNDGKNEIFLGNDSDGNYIIAIDQNGQEKWKYESKHSKNLTIEDIDNDDKEEIIFLSHRKIKIVSFHNLFEREIDLNECKVENFILNDFDSDGDLDIIAYGINEIYIFSNQTNIGKLDIYIDNIEKRRTVLLFVGIATLFILVYIFARTVSRQKLKDFQSKMSKKKLVFLLGILIMFGGFSILINFFLKFGKLPFILLFLKEYAITSILIIIGISFIILSIFIHSKK